jgi:hypothetical protein
MPVFSEDQLREMGYVCDWCGEVKPDLGSCREGCTKICAECFDKKGWIYTYCKTCKGVIQRKGKPRKKDGS